MIRKLDRWAEMPDDYRQSQPEELREFIEHFPLQLNGAARKVRLMDSITPKGVFNIYTESLRTAVDAARFGVTYIHIHKSLYLVLDSCNDHYALCVRTGSCPLSGRTTLSDGRNAGGLPSSNSDKWSKFEDIMKINPITLEII